MTWERPGPQPAQIRFEPSRPLSDDETWVLGNVPGVEYAEAYSPAMNMNVNMLIARPEDPVLREDAPTIYLLNGLIGGTGWFQFTDAVDFYTSRGVNVVMVTSGAFSCYTNWIQGNDQWDTFLAGELPLGLEPVLGANGKRAIMGVSMSATSALSLAQNNPGTYDGVASISGCASTTSPLGKIAADEVFASAHIPLTFEDVWGDPQGDYARYYDPMLNLRKLSDEFQGKDVAIFISSTSGLAGSESLTTTNDVAPGDVEQAINFVTVGGRIDIGANVCTHVLHQRMTMRGIDHVARFYPQGTHNWNSFKWAVPDSWPTLAPALGKQPL
ncbi:S-formylglutathione hydrolase FrmB [Corynebacterium mycetoides]|uniref:S-formylglutathione hydrolase FrmB n=1 Tax=Corynebacterium mycetoides TaxID=38302 RepID=A0A1G9NTW6_9CORY|nr:alpha/beta hydrolase family protein [Corynebacterium mycetoides]SDL90026.1 S-formylglutathione hydrolase FrmB [Corynebacterium mycetoides]